MKEQPYDKGRIIVYKTINRVSGYTYAKPSFKAEIEVPSSSEKSHRETTNKLLKKGVIEKHNGNEIKYTNIFLSICNILSEEELEEITNHIESKDNYSDDEDFEGGCPTEKDLKSTILLHEESLEFVKKEYALAIQEKDISRLNKLNALVEFSKKYSPRDEDFRYRISFGRLHSEKNKLRKGYAGKEWEEWRALDVIISEITMLKWRKEKFRLEKNYKNVETVKKILFDPVTLKKIYPTKAEIRRLWVEKYKNDMNPENSKLKTLALNMQDTANSAHKTMDKILERWGFSWLEKEKAGRRKNNSDRKNK